MRVLCGYIDLYTRICGSTRIYAGIVATLLFNYPHVQVGRLIQGREDMARARLELEIRCAQLEEARNGWEGKRLELAASLEQSQEETRTGLATLQELQAEHAKLLQQHEQFGREHAAALETTTRQGLAGQGQEDQEDQGAEDRVGESRAAAAPEDQGDHGAVQHGGSQTDRAGEGQGDHREV